MNQTAPSQPQPQAEQQALAVLVLNSHEVTLVHQALGELPAKQTEGVRAKIVMQAQNQKQVLDDLQRLIAESPALKSEPPAAPTAPASNVTSIKSKKAKAKSAAATESQTESAEVKA